MLIVGFATLLWRPTIAHADPKTWLISIGIDDYEIAKDVKYCVRDAMALRDLLEDLGAVNKRQVLLMTDESSPSKQPSYANLKTQMSRFLESVTEHDTLIFSFSGHGCVDAARNAYLAPSDLDPQKIAFTGLRLQEVRDWIRASPAARKFIFLDTCHSGAAQSAITLAELASLAKEPGVYTLTSCHATETSTWSNESRHGIFTYWLLRGLEGAADSDGNGSIGASELFAFVRHRVITDAQRVKERENPKNFTGMTPQQVAGPNIPQPDTVLTLKPQSYVHQMARITRLLRAELTHRGYQSIGVAEFTATADPTLAKFCAQAAAECRQQLAKRTAGRFRIGQQAQLMNPMVDDAVLLTTVTRLPLDKNNDSLRLHFRLLDKSRTPVFFATTIISVDDQVGSMIGQAQDAQLQNRQSRALVLRLGNVGGRQNDIVAQNSLAAVLKDRNGFEVTQLAVQDRRTITRNLARWVNSGAKQLSNAIVFCKATAAVDRGQVVLKTASGPSITLQELIRELNRMPQSHSSLDHVTLLLDLAYSGDQREFESALVAAHNHDSQPAQHVKTLVGWSAPSEQFQATGESHVEYHLAEGLRGSRSLVRESTNDIDLRRLADHLEDHLPRSFHVRILPETIDYDSTSVAETRPKSLDELVSDLARLLADQIRANEIEVVVVPDLLIDGDSNKARGNLAPYIRERLVHHLGFQCYGAFSIANDPWIRKLLDRRNVGPNNLTDPEVVKGLYGDIERNLNGKTFALVVVRMTVDDGGHVRLNLIPSSQDASLSTRIAGTAVLSTSEWAMQGDSGVNLAALQRASAPRAVQVVPVGDDPHLETQLDLSDPGRIQENVEEIHTFETAQHPLLDPGFPYRVSLVVSSRPYRNEAEAEIEFSEDGQTASVYLKKEDRYWIRIENQSREPVFMRALVDGLNTLPDYAATRVDPDDDRFVVPVKRRTGGLQPRQYVNLKDARSWFCHGATDKGSAVFGIRGFYRTIGQSSQELTVVDQFEVTDAELSQAAQSGFPDQVGLITIGFYRPVPQEKAHLNPEPRFGTTLGPPMKQKVDTYRGKLVPDEPIAFVQLRYGFERESD